MKMRIHFAIPMGFRLNLPGAGVSAQARLHRPCGHLPWPRLCGAVAASPDSTSGPMLVGRGFLTRNR